MTKLQQYLTRRGVSITAFAVIAGVSRQTIYRLLRGATCDLPTGIRVSKATFGEVSVEDLAELMTDGGATSVASDA